jgi:hypothetical protein
MIHLRRFFQVGGDNISFTVAELRDDKTRRYRRQTSL